MLAEGFVNSELRETKSLASGGESQPDAHAGTFYFGFQADKCVCDQRAGSGDELKSKSDRPYPFCYQRLTSYCFPTWRLSTLFPHRSP